MATLESLSRKLHIGEELHSVVGTMKALAAVSIHEFEEAVDALREYTTTIELGLQILFGTRPEAMPSEKRVSGRVAGIVVGSDQGLCGPINREIATRALEWFQDQEIDPADRLVMALGARVGRELSLLGVSVAQLRAAPSSVEAIGPQVEELIVEIDRWRDMEGIERVMVFYQHPLRRTQRSPRLYQVIPPDVRRFEGITERPWPTRMLPDSPHPWEKLLSGLLRQDLFVALYRAIAEAKAAEHGARLAAMQAAEQNIEERLDQLRNDYHQLRQAEITEQLLDVVSGSEALREE